VLKALITEPTLMLERKGVDAVPTRNMLAIAMASNNDWVVPAGPTARRYFVLDVPGHRRGDRPYFKALAAAVEGDETAALLHHLLNLDLSRFDVRDVPQTKALAEQKLLSGDSVQQWWFACLTRGYIKPVGDKWPEDIDRELLRGHYYDWCRTRGERHPVGQRLFGKLLRKLCLDGQMKTRRIGSRDSDRPRFYVLGDLDEHRLAFLQSLGIKPEGFDWGGGTLRDQSDSP
jgi:hypothetical protein